MCLGSTLWVAGLGVCAICGALVCFIFAVAYYGCQAHRLLRGKCVAHFATHRCVMIVEQDICLAHRPEETSLVPRLGMCANTCM